MTAAAEEGVKLISLWASPFVLRVRVALDLKGVAYEVVEETYGRKSELLLASNPVYKKVPVLFHGDRPSLCESMIIVEYVDEVWVSADGRSILPSDRYQRAVNRFWAVYIDDKVFTALAAIVLSQTQDERDKAVEQVSAGLQLLEVAFAETNGGSNKCFFGGDAIGYLDIALGSMLGWIRATAEMAGVQFLSADKTPLLAAWAERFCAHEAVRELMPDTHKLLEFSKLVQQVAAN